MNLMMITGDGGIAYGKKNIFWEMLHDFSKHFDRIDIICPSNEIGDEIVIHENVHLHPSSMSKKMHMDVFFHARFVKTKVKELMSQRDYGVIDVHIIPPFFNQVKGALAAAGNTPLLLELLHIPGHPKSASLGQFFEKWSLIRFLRKIRKKTQFVRIINEKEEREFLLQHNLIDPKNLIYITSFYLDFDIFRPTGVKRDPKTFIVAGRLAVNKGLFLILDAIKIVKNIVPDVQLKITGDGELRNEVEAYIAHHNLSQNVELLGWLPTQRDVAAHYNKATAMVMASYSEGGPRVTLEAMCCETPVLTSRVGSMIDIVKDGENALFIDWNAEDIAQKMLYILNHPDEAQKIGKTGNKEIQRFEKKHVLAQYAKAIHDISSQSS